MFAFQFNYYHITAHIIASALESNRKLWYVKKRVVGLPMLYGLSALKA